MISLFTKMLGIFDIPSIALAALVGDIVFISGAVDAQNIEFDMDETESTEETWSEIYEQVKEFFPELSVVGWFLSRMGFSTAVNDKIEKIHVDNFPGNDKVLFVTDSLECDDAFYMYQRGQLVKQKGYYIYYSRNEAMQKYIVHQKGGVADTENNEIKRKDQELIKLYRDKNSSIKEQKTEGINLIYVASAFVVLAMLAMGITVVSNYDKVKDMEVTINRLELTAQEEVVTPVLNNANDSTNVTTVSDDQVTTVTEAILNTASDMEGSTEESTEKSTEKSTEAASTQDNQAESVENLSTEQALPAVGQDITYYTIKDGDTLGTIALEYYGDISYVDVIAEANNMSVEDKIYMNDVLIIPDVKY